MRTAPREHASPAAGGREADPAGGLISAFEWSARSRPDAVAVACDTERLTYRDLDARANRVANHLLTRGVTPGALVGIFLDRSLDLVVGILGILKAGAAYVPLDPVAPAERLAFMVSDSGAGVVLTSGALASRLPEGPGLVRLDAEAEEIGRADATPPAAAPGPESLAYVIYTSGSTGVPKGTLVTHGNVLRLFHETEHWFHFAPEDVWTLFHSPAFDFSVWEIWGALLYGGRLVVVPYGVSRSPRDFHALLRDEGVTVLNQTPSAFRQLARVAVEPSLPARSPSRRLRRRGAEPRKPPSVVRPLRGRAPTPREHVRDHRDNGPRHVPANCPSGPREGRREPDRSADSRPGRPPPRREPPAGTPRRDRRDRRGGPRCRARLPQPAGAHGGPVRRPRG